MSGTASYEARFGSIPQYLLPGSFIPVVENDLVPLPPHVRGLWVGGTGSVVVKGINSANVIATFAAVPAGTYLQGRFAYLMEASTASLIIACCD